MKKSLVILLLVLVVVSSLGATPINYEYTPYEEAEFPLWSRELRRAETIFFGSYVFSLPVSYGVVNMATNMGMVDFNSSREKALSSIAVATGVSLFIAGLDWLLGRI